MKLSKVLNTWAKIKIKPKNPALDAPYTHCECISEQCDCTKTDVRKESKTLTAEIRRKAFIVLAEESNIMNAPEKPNTLDKKKKKKNGK